MDGVKTDRLTTLSIDPGCINFQPSCFPDYAYVWRPCNAANIIKAAYWKLYCQRRLALVLCCVKARNFLGNEAVPVKLLQVLLEVLRQTSNSAEPA